MSFLNIEEDPSRSFGTPSVDLDKYFKDNAMDCVVLHGRHLVYIATFSDRICKKITKLAASLTGLSYDATDEAVEGMRQVGNGDPGQKKNHAVYTANFGLTCRPQRSTSTSQSNHVKATDYAIGQHRGGKVKYPD